MRLSRVQRGTPDRTPGGSKAGLLRWMDGIGGRLQACQSGDRPTVLWGKIGTNGWSRASGTQSLQQEGVCATVHMCDYVCTHMCVVHLCLVMCEHMCVCVRAEPRCKVLLERWH